jgi:hypothetical protein
MPEGEDTSPRKVKRGGEQDECGSEGPDVTNALSPGITTNGVGEGEQKTRPALGKHQVRTTTHESTASGIW